MNVFHELSKLTGQKMRRVRGGGSAVHGGGERTGGVDRHNDHVRMMMMTMPDARSSDREDEEKGGVKTARRISWGCWMLMCVGVVLVIAVAAAAGMAAWSCWHGPSPAKHGIHPEEDPFQPQSQRRPEGPPRDVVFMKEEQVLPGNVLRQVRCPLFARNWQRSEERSICM